MLGDQELAEYLHGGMEPNTRIQFEERILEDDAAMSELVDQLRTHSTLQILGQKLGTEQALGQKLRADLIEAVRRKEHESLVSPGANNSRTADRGLMWAVLGLVLALLLAACLWHFAP